MNTQNATPELFTALAAAQAEIENASKNSVNPHFRSNYADLAEVLNTIKSVFPNHGLSITQSPSFDGTLCSVTTLIAHTSGGYITGEASCVPAKSDAQGIGSATTYLRRYSAAGMAGIAQEDDDGESAKHDKKPAAKAAAKPAPKPDPVEPTVSQEHQDKNKAFFSKYRSELIAEAVENYAMVFENEKAGLDWVAGLTKEACAKKGFKAGSIPTMPMTDLESLTLLITEIAGDRLTKHLAENQVVTA